MTEACPHSAIACVELHFGVLAPLSAPQQPKAFGVTDRDWPCPTGGLHLTTLVRFAAPNGSNEVSEGAGSPAPDWVWRRSMVS